MLTRVAAVVARRESESTGPVLLMTVVLPLMPPPLPLLLLLSAARVETRLAVSVSFAALRVVAAAEMVEVGVVPEARAELRVLPADATTPAA